MSAHIILAAGGTGGHLFPATALAREMLARGLSVTLATDSRGATYRNLPEGMAVAEISARNMVGGIMAKPLALLALAKGTCEAARLIRKLEPAAVVGFGGYPSLPTVAAAVFTQTPLVIHEQNSVLGRASRLFARFAKLIATSFPEVAKMPKGIPARDVGNPVRDAILRFAGAPYEAPAGDGPFNLFVTGGSQGARFFGQMIPEAVARLPAPLKKRLRLTLQCRKEDQETATARLAEAGIAHEVSHFFTDMPERIAACHMMIGRSGASTISELAIVGRPSLLIPLPSAMDDHQTTNARALVAVGGAWLMPQSESTPEAIAAFLAGVMEKPENLKAAASAARSFARPDAAKSLCDAVLSVAGKEPQP